jgi:hypothetical protein
MLKNVFAKLSPKKEIVETLAPTFPPVEEQ